MEDSNFHYDPKEDIVDRMRKRSAKTMNLLMVGVNIIVFFLVALTGGSDNYEHMLRWGAAYAPYIREGQVYRLFTCMFLHFSIEHLGSNMLLLLFLGDYLERYTGKLAYLVIYLGGGIVGNLCSYYFEWQKITMGGTPAVSAGASGGVFAVVGAMLVLLLYHRGQLEDLSFRRMMLMAVGSLIVGFQSSNVDNQAHLGGFLAGAVLMLLLYPVIQRVSRWKKHRNTDAGLDRR